MPLALNAERTLFLEDNSQPDRRLIDANAGWFHVIASTSGATGPERAGNFRLWINGANRTANLQPNVVGWGVETEFAKIGGRGDSPTAPQTHSGAQDEVAIWLNRVLTDAEAASLWTAATTGVAQRPRSQSPMSPGMEPPRRHAHFPRRWPTSTYAVDRSANLAAWSELTKTLMATGAQTTFVDSLSGGACGELFFYRVRKVQ